MQRRVRCPQIPLRAESSIASTFGVLSAPLSA
jgi:hypothetical protein